MGQTNGTQSPPVKSVLTVVSVVCVFGVWLFGWKLRVTGQVAVRAWYVWLLWVFCVNLAPSYVSPPSPPSPKENQASFLYEWRSSLVLQIKEGWWKYLVRRWGENQCLSHSVLCILKHALHQLYNGVQRGSMAHSACKVWVAQCAALIWQEAGG